MSRRTGAVITPRSSATRGRRPARRAPPRRPRPWGRAASAPSARSARPAGRPTRRRRPGSGRCARSPPGRASGAGARSTSGGRRRAWPPSRRWVAPELAVGREGVGRHAGHDVAPEQAGVGAHVDRAGGDVEGQVPHDPHPARGCVITQRPPLALEAHLVGHRVAAGGPRPVGRPVGVALQEVGDRRRAHGRAGAREQPWPGGEGRAARVGEPWRSGGVSGSTCHQDWPAAASQSTKRKASGPRRPPGSEVTCSSTPARRARGGVVRCRLGRHRERLRSVPPVPAPPPRTPPPRIQVHDVRPAVEGGRWPAKRTAGEVVVVECDLVRDGHEALRAACATARRARARSRRSRWRSSARTAGAGVHHRRARDPPLPGGGVGRPLRLLARRARAQAGRRAGGPGGRARRGRRAARGRGRAAEGRRPARRRGGPGGAPTGNGFAERADAALAPEVSEALARDPERRDRSRSEPLEIDVDRERARVGAWYELFPRSFGGFAGVQLQLPRLADLGFDVIYLPPIHPIGRTHRKGRNNAPAAAPGEPGSPWAIGGPEGATPRSTLSSGPSRTSPASSRRPAITAWRSPSTSRSSARPTTPG